MYHGTFDIDTVVGMSDVDVRPTTTDQMLTTLISPYDFTITNLALKSEELECDFNCLLNTRLKRNATVAIIIAIYDIMATT